MRVTIFLEEWPESWGDVWRLGIWSDVFECLHDVAAVGNERDDSNPPTSQLAQKREHHVDVSDEDDPQIMLGAFGPHRLGRGRNHIAQRHRTRRARP